MSQAAGNTEAQTYRYQSPRTGNLFLTQKTHTHIVSGGKKNFDHFYIPREMHSIDYS